MSIARWFAHSLWQPSGKSDRYHHDCRRCGAALKQARGEALREVALVLFGFVGAMTLFYRTYPLLPHQYGWWLLEFAGWTLAGGSLTTLMHYPLARYVLASPETHAHIPLSKVVSAGER